MVRMTRKIRIIQAGGADGNTVNADTNRLRAKKKISVALRAKGINSPRGKGESYCPKDGAANKLAQKGCPRD